MENSTKYNHPPIIAVDFDRTLSLNSQYPNVGEPNIPLINWLIQQRKENDAKIILWTCREDESLDIALRFCSENGLKFDAVNDNIDKSVFNSRKIFANIYIDDLAINVNDIC